MIQREKDGAPNIIGRGWVRFVILAMCCLLVMFYKGWVRGRDRIFWDHIIFIRIAFFRTALYLGGFLAHGFFADGFLFSVKELGFWNNPGHWVRVLDVVGSYMYFVL
jgi:hypothetical protein